MRSRIMRAAMRLFVKGGVSAVTMRAIAARIEYSPAAIYRYFPSKNEILLGLCREGFTIAARSSPADTFPSKTRRREGFTMLLDTLRTATGKDPFQRLLQQGRLYLDFAMDHPDHYELLFSTPEVIKAPFSGKDSVAMQAFGHFRDTVELCAKEGIFGSGDPEALAVSLWSSLHGLASLIVNDQFRFLPEEKRAVTLEEAFTFFFRGAGNFSAEHATANGEPS